MDRTGSPPCKYGPPWQQPHLSRTSVDGTSYGYAYVMVPIRRVQGTCACIPMEDSKWVQRR
jgi:hypothetical protein